MYLNLIILQVQNNLLVSHCFLFFNLRIALLTTRAGQLRRKDSKTKKSAWLLATFNPNIPKIKIFQMLSHSKYMKYFQLFYCFFTFLIACRRVFASAFASTVPLSALLLSTYFIYVTNFKYLIAIFNLFDNFQIFDWQISFIWLLSNIWSAQPMITSCSSFHRRQYGLVSITVLKLFCFCQSKHLKKQFETLNSEVMRRRP